MVEVDLNEVERIKSAFIAKEAIREPKIAKGKVKAADKSLLEFMNEFNASVVGMKPTEKATVQIIIGDKTFTGKYSPDETAYAAKTLIGGDIGMEYYPPAIFKEKSPEAYKLLRGFIPSFLNIAYLLQAIGSTYINLEFTMDKETKFTIMALKEAIPFLEKFL